MNTPVYAVVRKWQPTPVFLAWRIPWMEEPGRLQSMGSLRVGHDWATSLSRFIFMHWRRKWQPLQCSCLENPRDRGAWWAAIYGVTRGWTQLKWLSSSSSRSSNTTKISKASFSLHYTPIICSQVCGRGKVLGLTPAMTHLGWWWHTSPSCASYSPELLMWPEHSHSTTRGPACETLPCARKSQSQKDLRNSTLDHQDRS